MSKHCDWKARPDEEVFEFAHLKPCACVRTSGGPSAAPRVAELLEPKTSASRDAPEPKFAATYRAPPENALLPSMVSEPNVKLLLLRYTPPAVSHVHIFCWLMHGWSSHMRLSMEEIRLFLCFVLCARTKVGRHWSKLGWRHCASI